MTSFETKIDTAWLAGIIEGNSALIRTTSGGWSLYVIKADRDVVERVHEIAGAGSINFRPRAAPHYKDQWAWRCSRRADVERIITRIRPFLGERRGTRADEFLAWYRGKARSGGSAIEEPKTSAKVRAQTAARARAYRARRRAEREATKPSPAPERA